MRRFAAAMVLFACACPQDPAASHCIDAHEDLSKMMEGARKFAPPGESSNYTPPDRAQFVETCKSLPVDLQKCLVVEYAQQNKKQCLEVERSVDPKTLVTFQKLIAGK